MKKVQSSSTSKSLLKGGVRNMMANEQQEKVHRPESTSFSLQSCKILNTGPGTKLTYR